jgi:cytochrome c oxidase cbb3-type subunit II
MKSEIRLISGAMVMLALSTSALVVLPYMQVRDTPPLPGLKPYSSAELRGRAVYIAPTIRRTCLAPCEPGQI